MLARRCTVVTPGLRGFGSSTTPDSKGEVDLYAKDMFAVMDHLHVRKAIIGGMGMPQMLTTPTRTSNPALVKFIGGIVKKGSVNAAAAGGSTPANRPDSRPMMAHAKISVLIVVGQDDPIYPLEMA